MSDRLHGSTCDLEALADEICAESKRRDSEQFKPSQYRGLTSVARRRKYRKANAEYVAVQGGTARLLSADEIAQFKQHMAWLLGGDLPTLGKRKAVV